ncbi:MAG: hypothetical protein NTY43_02585 [Bacteroidetes bacterium]|jgi:tRNA(Phe) wybutosine-synthesizing methylase Tyw3|nr:hypothetical protein [Bacteroidota bacterium]
MKRIVTICLVLLYTVASIGATVTTHSCAGKVRTCKCGKPSKKDLCCSEKTIYLKSQDNHQFQASTNSIVKKLNYNIDKATYTIQNIVAVAHTSKSFIAKKALLDIGPPIYEFICVYLI